MRKPVMSGSQPSNQPNEPKIYPGDDGIKSQPGGKLNQENHHQHKTVSIGSDEVYGKKATDGRSMHMDPKGLSPHIQGNFAGRGKLPSPKSVSIKPRLPKPKV